ncbi:MAG: hypothetical protein NT115_16715 [Proteobacteria bacterium]|nr:hypothetical protein [Pseudomonadota bacterium]
MRPNKAFTVLATAGVALLLVTAIDHLVAASRASGLCEALRPGLNGDQVRALINGLEEQAGVVRVRGDPARMLTAPPAPMAREEFMQFAIVFKGLLFRTRQCVVSVKSGRVESSQVTNTDAYVTLNPVPTVRILGGAAR